MSVILASQSPQRERILRLLGIEPTIFPSEFDERAVPTDSLQTSEQFSEYAQALAAGKVLDVLSRLQVAGSISEATVILGGDLVLVHDGDIYHKPRNFAEAEAYTRQLAGVTHQEYSALAVWSPQRGLSTQLAVAQITTPSLTEEELKWYLNHSQPLGAAGGYRIGAIARALRPRRLPLDQLLQVHGSISAIIGLPAQPAVQLLQHHGITIPRSAESLEEELLTHIFAENQPAHLQTLFYTQE